MQVLRVKDKAMKQINHLDTNIAYTACNEVPSLYNKHCLSTNITSQVVNPYFRSSQQLQSLPQDLLSTLLQQ